MYTVPDLAKLILPEGLSSYFDIIRVMDIPHQINIYLEEMNVVPSEYKNDKLESKGFYEEVEIQDYPIRAKKVYLYIRRRRWTNHTKGEIVSGDWTLVAQGTRITSEFASFLKELSRLTSH